MPFNPDPRHMVALLATLLLASCAAVAPGPSRLLPPVELLQPCGGEYPVPTTNGALARQREALLDALRGCNRDKASLREWAEE
jgi:hypothetical protein